MVLSARTFFTVAISFNVIVLPFKFITGMFKISSMFVLLFLGTLKNIDTGSASFST